MLATLTLGCLLLAPQAPASQPSSRPTSGPAQDDRARLATADWPDDAPGRQVMARGGEALKFLPMEAPPYGTPDDVADRVRDIDLVVGLQVADQAFAYPINMLGGPQREIVNDQHAGVAFCVNW
ncbi:MAG: hypothetical protein AAF628_24845 [Planctomycetota bacterium]